MLNKYFKAIEGNTDFLFANMAIENIYFAQISLWKVLYTSPEDIDIGTYHDAQTYYFYYLQNLLTACGNICNVFHNQSRSGGQIATERCRRLRMLFGITQKDFPLIFQKEARNTNEHFDERYDVYRGMVGDYNVIDKNTASAMRSTIMGKPHLRTYDQVNRIYYTFDKNGKRISYDLRRLDRELDEMLRRIQNSCVAESAWVTENSCEILK